MKKKIKVSTHTKSRKTKKPKWVIKPLLDETTRKELREFYRSLRSAENSTTLLKGFTPPPDE
jgi:hypothetical protein